MRIIFISLSLCCLCFRCTKSPLSKYPSVDLAITNATIIDGTGDASFAGHIYIVDDQIAYVGPDIQEHDNIQESINANDKVVAPGFIDLHAHGNPLKTPDFENFLAMGVTTICLGQDGSSPNVPELKVWMDEVTTSGGTGPNIIMFIGHGTLRNITGIGSYVEIDTTQLMAMMNYLDVNLPYAFGLSTGLEYTPGLFASEQELIALSEKVGTHGGMVMSHMRNEDDDAVIASIQELIRQGSATKVHIAHIKSVYGNGATRAEEILAVIDSAQNAGVNLTADIYPYEASYTGISIVFPDWSKTSDQFEMAKAQRLPELKEFLRNKVNSRNGPSATLIGTAPFTGMTLAQVADSLNKTFEDVLIENIGPGNASAAYFVMDSALQSRLAQASYISIASDGSPTGFHPRGHGTFARLFEELVINRELFSIEEAVRKVTSQPAEVLNITDRGLLKQGMKADIIMFDPTNVRESATYDNPHQLAQGFDLVIVNGRIARHNGTLQRQGKFLFRPPL